MNAVDEAVWLWQADTVGGIWFDEEISVTVRKRS
jgi:phage terminase large subunit-like protein